MLGRVMAHILDMRKASFHISVTCVARAATSVFFVSGFYRAIDCHMPYVDDIELNKLTRWLGFSERESQLCCDHQRGRKACTCAAVVCEQVRRRMFWMCCRVTTTSLDFTDPALKLIIRRVPYGLVVHHRVVSSECHVWQGSFMKYMNGPNNSV